SIDGIPIGRIAFNRPVASRFSFADLWADLTAPRLSRFKRAFFSYSHSDRKAVLGKADEFRRLGIEFFQDILSLDPGERWKSRLWSEIDRCDVFILFWSKAASESEFVLKEADRAWRRWARSGGKRPSLMPEILEHPSPVPTEAWLAEFHLDDAKYYRQGRR